MQTFLPSADFDQVARTLDSRRLGKQRVEAYQILRALSIPTYGWRHHPAVRMWRGYDDALRLYMNACIREWVRRGYHNTMPLEPVSSAAPLPAWLGDERLHASHRSNLLRKDPDYYQQFGWTEPPNLPYYWPTQACDPQEQVGEARDAAPEMAGRAEASPN